MARKDTSFFTSLRDAVESTGILEGLHKLTDALPQVQLRETLAFDALPDRAATSSGTCTLTIATGVTVVAVTALGVKSIWKMMSWRRSLRDEATQGPAAGPTPLPFVGNILELRSGYYEALYRHVDKPASVFWVMSTPFVVVNEEDGLRKVLGGAKGLYTKPKYFGYRSKAVTSAVQSERDKVAKESIEYHPNGDTSRKALEHMVVDSFDRIKLSMQNLLDDLEEASAEDTSEAREDSVRFIRRAIVALNLDVLFGLSGDKKNAEDPNRIASMIEFAGGEFARRMVNPLKVFVDIPSNIRFFRDVGGLIALGRRLCKILDDAASCVKTRATSGAAVAWDGVAGLSWVHAWIGKVGKIGKLGKVVGLLMASTQTVPLTAVWMLHLVANDAQTRTMLRRELYNAGVHSLSALKYSDLEKLELADAVIKETLRLYPPFPLIQRQAQESDVLGGVTVPAGTIVYVVPWLVHRNARFWSEPHEFRPGRFLKNKSHGDAPSDWAYLPFGRGPRMCAGSKLAMAQFKVLLCHALLSFDWESRCLSERDGRFPELGMVPRGVRMTFKSVKNATVVDAVG